jgi:hypothetical protein
VVIVTAVPSAKLSPGRMSGYIAARAAVNGVLIMVTANSSPTRTGSGSSELRGILLTFVRLYSPFADW